VLAVDRIYTEVANTYPGFALRGLDWDQITQRHAHLPELHGEEFLLGVQWWIAELGDAHTSARRPTAEQSVATTALSCWAARRNRAGDPSAERLTAKGRLPGRHRP
jgi:hypothetical protein